MGAGGLLLEICSRKMEGEQVILTQFLVFRFPPFKYPLAQGTKLCYKMSRYNTEGLEKLPALFEWLPPASGP